MKKIVCWVGFLLLLSATQAQAEKEPQLEIAVVPATQYGPIKKGEALWRIAGKLRPNKKISHQQMMLALLRNNPQAFRLPCNLHTLLPQSILYIPSEADIKQLSIQQAITLFAAQEAQWKSQRWDIVCDEEILNTSREIKTKPVVSNELPDKQARNSLADTSNAHSSFLPDTQAKTQSMLEQHNVQVEALDNPFPFNPLSIDKVAQNSQRQDLPDTPLREIVLSEFPKQPIDITENSTKSLRVLLQNVLMLLGGGSLFILPIIWLRHRRKRLHWKHTRAQMRRRQATLKKSHSQPMGKSEKVMKKNNIVPDQIPTTVMAKPIMTVEVHEAVKEVVVKGELDFNASPVATTVEIECADAVIEQHEDKSETIDPITRADTAQLEPADDVNVGKVMLDELDDLLADNVSENYALENAADKVHTPFDDSDFDALDDNVEALDADSFNELLSFSDEKSVK
jgi:FimV-like protein